MLDAGVGKSSIAANIAIALATTGKKVQSDIRLISSKSSPSQVGLVDLDICGPSIPQLMSVAGEQVVSSEYGWTPLK